MIVFILFHSDHDDDRDAVLGVFSSRDAALRHLATISLADRRDLYEGCIEKLDDPSAHSAEPYEILWRRDP